MTALGEEISQESLEYLASLEKWVLRGEAEQVKALPLFDRFLVLRGRMLHADWNFAVWRDYREARGDSGLGAIWLPLISYHFLDYSLGKVKYYEGIAGGPLLLGSKEVETRIRFINEGKWKVDLVGLFRDEFEDLMVPYMGADFNNRNRVDEMLKVEFGAGFAKDLYQPRLED